MKHKKRDWQDEKRRNPLKCCTGGVPCDDPPPPSSTWKGEL